MAADLPGDFRALFDFLPIGAYRSSPEGRQLRANAALVRLNGYDSEAQLLAAVRDIGAEWYVQPGRRDEFRRLLERDGHVLAFVSEVHRHRTRERIWVSENARLVRDAVGGAMYYEGTVEEVTDRVRAAEALARSERHLREIAEHVPGMIYRLHTTPAGLPRYSFVSEGVRALYGVEPQQLIDDPRLLRQWRHPEDHARVSREVDAAWAARGPLRIEYRIVMPDGRIKWLQMSSSDAGNDGDEIVRVGVLMDVTARHEADAALRESEARWKLALDSIGDGIWELDLKRGRGVLSERCRVMHGLAADDIDPEGFSPSLDALTHPDDLKPMLRDREAHFTGRAPLYVNEHRVRHGDGRWRWVLSRGLVIERDARGQPLRMIGTHTDITERKEAEALRAERDRAEAAQHAMTVFLSRVSHELRTPLNAILGFTQLLQTDPATAERHQPWLTEVLASGRHLLALVSDMLDLTGAQSGQLQVAIGEVPLVPVIDECLAMLATDLAQKALTVERAGLADVQAIVRGDRLRLKQVVSNLLSNAVKYNRRGGRVRLGMRARGAQWLLDITDDGPGLDEGQRALLFTPFERLGAQAGGIPGSGLGLSLARQLTKAMGGDIEVQSRPGEGSRFTLALTVSDA